LLENLVGVDKLENLNTEIEGLACEEEKIIFKFSKSTKDILYKLSFGLYSIVHPSSFNHLDGKWLNKKVIASGNYSISERKEDSLILELRNQENEYGHKSKYKRISLELYNVKNSYDIALMDSRFQNQFANLVFRGGAVAGIQYLTLTKWGEKKSRISLSETRQQFQKMIYRKLKNEGFLIPNNFFISSQENAIESEDVNDASFKGEKIKVLDILNLFQDNKKYAESILNAIKYTVEKMQGELELVKMDISTLFEEKKKNYPSLDIVMSSTTLYIASPYTDIKFMFNSKEGIRLPDPTGKLKQITEEENFNINVVNKQIHQDSIVIPVFHFIKGFFYSKEVDTELFSNRISSVDFNWIGEY